MVVLLQKLLLKMVLWEMHIIAEDVGGCDGEIPTDDKEVISQGRIANRWSSVGRDEKTEEEEREERRRLGSTP